jgi:hypothetical protein
MHKTPTRVSIKIHNNIAAAGLCDRVDVSAGSSTCTTAKLIRDGCYRICENVCPRQIYIVIS